MRVFVRGRFTVFAGVAAIASAVLLAACAENKPPAPEPQAAAPGVVPGSPQDFVLNVGDRVFFAENSAELSQTSIALLDKQSVWLAKYSAYRITLEGHSDEKGGNKKNKRLSEQRALAVENYLAAHGVDKARMHTLSFGRERRVATCNDASCWSQNRRVVTVLETGAEPRPRVPPRTPQPVAQQPSAQMPVYASPPSGGFGAVRSDPFNAPANGVD